MASGDSLLYVTAHQADPPDANAAVPDLLAGGSTPAEQIPVLDFDAATVEYTDFRLTLPRHYGAGGITVRIVWSADTATTAETVWSAALRRIADDAERLSTSHAYAYNNAAAATAPTLLSETSHDEIAFTDGADMDSVAANNDFILRVRRFATDAGDDMAGDALLHSIEIRET